jgi:hypothetical protein
VNGRSDYSFFELGGIDVVLGIASGCGIGAILMQEKKHVARDGHGLVLEKN